jgi:DNA-binding MarR family transcriptional regulator
MRAASQTEDAPAEVSDEIVDAVLQASRALVAVAARSLAGLEDVTLPQYRALVVLAARGPQRSVDLAARLGVNPSTAGRMSDRLVAKGLVRRRRDAADRRTVRLSLTAAGRDLVGEATRRRRSEISAIVANLPASHAQDVVTGLRAFAAAAGETPEQDWHLGWE